MHRVSQVLLVTRQPSTAFSSLPVFDGVISGTACRAAQPARAAAASSRPGTGRPQTATGAECHIGTFPRRSPLLLSMTGPVVDRMLPRYDGAAALRRHRAARITTVRSSE